ncbi:MAG: hypothetical protein ABIX28_06970 [Vicinamibacterales bacterium]
MTGPVTMSRRMAARPQPIHAVIADYHDGHRRIVPPRVFTWLAVEKGGMGAGTEIRFAMRVMGSTRVSRGIVTEPDPGRTIVETYPETGIVTTFLIEPAGANDSVVTITTDLRLPRGLAARGPSPAAFDTGCIPGASVATRANTVSILTRRALSAGRGTRLGATRDLHHGLLLGKVQGFFTRRLLRPLYVEELERLADLVEGRLRHAPVPTHPGA